MCMACTFYFQNPYHFKIQQFQKKCEEVENGFWIADNTLKNELFLLFYKFIGFHLLSKFP